MTSPLTPEAVAQMVADREAGTPGPWKVTEVVDDQIHVHATNRDPNRFAPIMTRNMGFNDDVDVESRINARRIARLPDLEAAYLTLAAENATLRAERDSARDGCAAVIEARDMMGRFWTTARDELATLRASEAAALGRVAVLEKALRRASERMRLATGLEFGEHQIKTMEAWAKEARAALTPTADKE